MQWRRLSRFPAKMTLAHMRALHIYIKRQTRVCTTWPSFLFTSRLLFIISTPKWEVSRNFLSAIRFCFDLFLSSHFLFWEILNLPSIVYVKLKSLILETLNITFIRHGKREFVYHVTKLSIYLGFTVHYNNTKITPILSIRIVYKLFLSAHYSFAKIYFSWEEI